MVNDCALVLAVFLSPQRVIQLSQDGVRVNPPGVQPHNPLDRLYRIQHRSCVPVNQRQAEKGSGVVRVKLQRVLEQHTGIVIAPHSSKQLTWLGVAVEVSSNPHLPLFGSTRREAGEMIMGAEGSGALSETVPVIRKRNDRKLNY